MYWKYPILLEFMSDRIIENLKEIFICDDLVTNYTKWIKNKSLHIGYIIHSTSGLREDDTLCLFRFEETWLQNRSFKDLINIHSGRTCIIDEYSESWGHKKVKMANTYFKTWISEYLENNECDKETTINDNLNIRIKICL
tara:strand:- start:832 stop:1251 length:420 start_codon:yes stop_codon:yes gene_type:complete